MLQHTVAIRSFSRILLQTLCQKVFSFLADTVPGFAFKSKNVSRNALRNFFFIITHEWGLAAHHYVDDNADAPNVHLSIILFLFDYLGWHVKRTAENLSHLLVLLEVLGEAEVGYLDLELLSIDAIDEDVFRLDISVGYLLLVHVV